ncbi:/ / putative methyltransferase / 577606:578748 Forward [Candidatus Hepatoplasma crinochetorum]|uniref:/ / putative methyltransferase / 577606:578748 Forward n=1 Tax=Candidatus Hepatoplasma crinochetorum TaxID=295596 RepID=A0A0G7ZN44_9MOLU|nr:/ / putative methyltransferase / 577606:578748 Forward [Candidatus Hepatoplasma crinochetorum]
MQEKTNNYKNELHSICTYLAMFPHNIPHEYIKKYTNKGDIVYDPFSGRGTTILESLLLERKAIGNDLAPLAYVLTRAKTINDNLNKIIKRVNKLKKEYDQWKNINKIDLNNKDFKDVKYFYSENNLNQLFFLREKIGKNYKKLDKINNFILAIALGLMHGQIRKDNSTIYFSISMPNGYSMSPNYVKNYKNKYNLILPETNIFEQIIDRVLVKLKNNKINNLKLESKIFNKDALKSKEFIRKEKPKLIFTSPPYLNAVNYVEQNWLRYWLLGFNKEENKNIKLDDKHSKEKYKNFLKNFIVEMEKILDQNGKLIIVIGDLKNKKIKIEEIIKEIILNIKNLKISEEIKKEKINLKLSRQMGKSKEGKLINYDWYFIIEKKEE